MSDIDFVFFSGISIAFGIPALIGIALAVSGTSIGPVHDFIVVIFVALGFAWLAVKTKGEP